MRRRGYHAIDSYGGSSPMHAWRWRRRIPILLFYFCLTMAVLLTAMVLAAPWLAESDRLDGWAKKLCLIFAQDRAVRRIALACAAGLAATAYVFFRYPTRRPPRSPSDVIGA